MLWIRLHKNSYYNALKCFGTLEVFLNISYSNSSASYKKHIFLSLIRVISYEEGKALAESWNAAFLESSAKENQVMDLRVTLFK